MKRVATAKRILGPPQALVLLLVLLCALWATGAGATEKEPGQGAAAEGVVSRKNYSSLADLVALVGADAMEQLHGFFAAEPVTVEPFLVRREFSNRRGISLLGAALAEQMATVIGNESPALWRFAGAGEHEQQVFGVLQEMDGYLRIHIVAVNTRGARRSYAVNVEMSEPVYRALHSYVYQ